MSLKFIIIMLLLAVLISLFGSAFFLVKDDSKRRRTLTGLKVRITLSVMLIMLILLSYALGWIQPHPPGH